MLKSNDKGDVQVECAYGEEWCIGVQGYVEQFRGED